MEASANGCAVIITNRGGLPETVTNAKNLKSLSVKRFRKNSPNELITKDLFKKKIAKLSIKNFYLTHKFISNLIDNYRSEKINKNIRFTTRKKS